MSEAARCPKCRTQKTWVDCDQCEDGFSHHDCGEDCCCCLNPINNVACDTCRGANGWYACLKCADPGWVGELIDDGRIFEC